MRFSHISILFLTLSVTSVAALPISAITHSLASLTTPASSIFSRGYPVTFPGKRGLVYDWLSQDYCKYFVGSKKVKFGSDWHATRSETGATFDNSFGFIPTLTVDKNLRNDQWVDSVKAQIKDGVKTVFASNEPDHSSQANLKPAQAAQVYKQYMMPLKGLGAGLATPSITNGGGTMGLNYLESFISYCSDCSFDVINVHHYVQRSDCNVEQAVAALKYYIDVTVAAVQARHPQLKGLPICIGEFWLWNASDSEGAEYLRLLLPWLDGHSQIACYQAFGGLWKGRFINDAGTGLTQAGSVYRDY